MDYTTQGGCMIKNIIIEGLKSHFKGNIDKHIANVNVLLENPVGVAEHADTLETIEKELLRIADYDAQMEMLTKYFNDNPETEADDFVDEIRDI